MPKTSNQASTNDTLSSTSMNMCTVYTTIICLFIQANGLDERWNQTLQQMLVKFVAERKDTWEEFLDTCVFAYNTSRHDSSKYWPILMIVIYYWHNITSYRFTPFEIMFGRRAIHPVDVEMGGI